MTHGRWLYGLALKILPGQIPSGYSGVAQGDTNSPWQTMHKSSSLAASAAQESGVRETKGTSCHLYFSQTTGSSRKQWEGVASHSWSPTSHGKGSF